MKKLKSSRYREMFEVHSTENHGKYGKRMGPNKMNISTFQKGLTQVSSGVNFPRLHATLYCKWLRKPLIIRHKVEQKYK